jgi:hypothetical protein
MAALGVGGKECQQNMGEKFSLKTSTWKINIDFRKMGSGGGRWI